MRRQAEPADAEMPPAIVPAPRLAPTEAARRWAAVLQQFFEVDPLACPACHGAMRIVACITQPSAIDQILSPLRARAATAAHGGARSPPATRGPSGRAPRDDPPRPTGPLASHSDAPITRGVVRCARQTHRGVRSVPAATGRPRETLCGHPPGRGGGRRAGRRAPGGPRGSAIAPDVRRILDRPRLNFLSCLVFGNRAAAAVAFVDHIEHGGGNTVSTFCHPPYYAIRTESAWKAFLARHRLRECPYSSP